MKDLFKYRNSEASLKNMEESLAKLDDKVNCKPSLDGIRVIRQQLARPTRFIETMKSVFVSNTMNARNSIKAVVYNPSAQATGELDKDVAKYKVLYERQVEMLSTVKTYETTCLQIKAEVIKMSDLINRLCDFVDKIDNNLVDQIIPEVIRRQRWEQMSQDYLKKYREWVNLEDNHREEFFSMFKFNEVPEVFGQLLLSEYQIPNNEFLQNSEYQNHLTTLNGFFDESKNFYSEWSQYLKEICKSTHVSILRREKIKIEKENETLAKHLTQARETCMEKQDEIDAMKAELDDLINKHSATGNFLMDEKTKAEDLRTEIGRLNDLCSLQEKSIKNLKAERDALTLELQKVRETSQAAISEQQNRLNTNDTELGALERVISEKNQQIDSLKRSQDALQTQGNDLKRELDATKAKLSEIERKLETIVEVKDSLVKENTKLKDELAKKS